jgi:hypothetical protein
VWEVARSKASHGVNFIVAHDGFTLADLVAYNGKHNEANGEDGKDGTNDNFSWNCGVEGATGDEGVKALRWRQMRNFQLMLMMSRGTPMVVAGARYGGLLLCVAGGCSDGHAHRASITCAACLTARASENAAALLLLAHITLLCAAAYCAMPASQGTNSATRGVATTTGMATTTR